MCHITSFVIEAIVELKERWTEYRNPRKLQKFASLFVSPTADHVAVAFRNQITFLQKDNDYQEPTGTFNSKSLDLRSTRWMTIGFVFPLSRWTIFNCIFKILVFFFNFLIL